MYSAIDRQYESLAAVNVVESGADPVATTLGAEFFAANVEPAFTDVSNHRKSIRPVEAISLSRKENIVTPASKAVSMRPFVATQKTFEPTVITYPGAMPGGLQSENYQLSAKIATRSKKRSFFSKSVSVLKKPYDWLKAIGSKIN